jgi:hypothetical protein
MLKLTQNYQKISELFSLSKNDLNKKLLQKEEKEKYLNYKNENGYSKYSYVARKYFLKELLTEEIKNEISQAYNNGYGIKSIAAQIEIGYTNCRLLLNSVGVEIRKGTSVVTEKLKEMRKNKSNTEKNNKTGWFCENIRKHLKIESKTQRGVQGWYFNESMQKWVWLRSTYEYIFAKWLDRTKHLWDIEVITYKIEEETYRPDFFIYDCDGKNIIKIVEIKGYYDNRAYKVELLNEILNVDVCIIGLTNKTISQYIESNSNYGLELKKWKIIRKHNEDKKNNN